MNTNMARFRWFSKNLSVLVLRTKVALALEGLRVPSKIVCIHDTFDNSFGIKNGFA